MADAWAPQRAAVRQALRDAGLKQVEIAKRVGTTQKHISCVLNGKSHGSLELWADLAAVVGMEWSLAPPLIGGGQDTRHTFTVRVNIRGHGADWSSDMVPQEVPAYSLAEALRLAAEIPLGAWFPDEESDG